MAPSLGAYGGSDAGNIAISPEPQPPETYRWGEHGSAQFLAVVDLPPSQDGARYLQACRHALTEASAMPVVQVCLLNIQVPWMLTAWACGSAAMVAATSPQTGQRTTMPAP